LGIARGLIKAIKVMQFEPDLLILDLIMPRMDGFEVCKLIKKDSTFSHIKIPVLTGYPTDENIERVTEADVNGFLGKPVDTDTLLRHIKDLLGKDRAYRLRKLAAN
jgi:CheY-like chemotaxis protein